MTDDSQHAQAVMRSLRAEGVTIEPGLTEQEVADAEEFSGARFGTLHRTFLRLGLPVGDTWPDWRLRSPHSLRARMDAVVDGVLSDVESGWFWSRTWGPAPADPDERSARARPFVEGWPRLLPLYGHRYLPAAPADRGAPVLSVVGTDVIEYGADLESWAHREFGVGDDRAVRGSGWDEEALPPWSRFTHGLLVDGEGEIDRGQFVAALGDAPMALPDIEVIGIDAEDTPILLRALQDPDAPVEVRASDGSPDVIVLRLGGGMTVNCWPGPTARFDFDLRALQAGAGAADADRRFDGLRVFLRFLADTLGRTVEVVEEGASQRMLVVPPMGRTGS